MKRAALVALLLAVAAAPLAAQVNQDSLERVRRREQSLREEAARRRELEEVRRQAEENRQRARQLKGRENQALGQLRRTERELNQTRRRLSNLQRNRASLTRQLGATRANLERTSRTLEQQKARLSQRLRAMYKAGAGRDLEFLLSTRSFAQLLARWDFLVMVAEQDRLLLEDVEHKKEQVEADERQLEENEERVVRNTQQTTAENQKLARLRRERASTVSQIRTQRQAYEAAAAELEKTARDLVRLLARLERQRKEEEERARAQGRAPEPYTGDFARGRGALDWPLRGEVVGRYGQERHPRFNTVTMNNGIDIAVPPGTAVRSVAKGRVDYTSDDFSSFGQIIVINHGDGYYTLYGHLSEIHVSSGAEVQSGQVVGRSGETGTQLKGPVLHFEVRKGGQSLDPQDWLK